MRLYTFISNERGVHRQLGANKKLLIQLTHETKKESYHISTEEILIRLEWQDEQPTLNVILPPSWLQSHSETIGDGEDEGEMVKNFKFFYLPKDK